MNTTNQSLLRFPLIYDSKQNATLCGLRDFNTHGFLHIKKKDQVISDRLSHLFHRGFH